MRRIALVILCLAMVEGCTLPGLVPTAVPMPTSIALPTDIPTPLPSETPTPIPTATNTPSPTPDLGVIDADPQELVLQLSDLPADGKYKPSANPYHYTNEKVLANWVANHNMSPVDQQIYLDKTGRLDGWFVVFSRGVSSAQFPVNIMNVTALHSSAQGAQYTVENYEVASLEENQFVELNEVPKIGDITRAYKEMTLKEDGTVASVNYRLVFTYRNVYCKVTTVFVGDTGSLEINTHMAQLLFERLLQQPLSDAVTYQP